MISCHFRAHGRRVGSDDVYVTKVTYTDSSTDADPESTTQDSCAAAKELVSVSWAYNNVPTHVSDYMCVYADRRLYEQHTGNLNTNAISLTDTRPSMGTGHSQVSLIAHFKFDDGILNSADPDDTATTTTTGYDSFEPCGDGVLCMKTSMDTTGYEWSDSSTMAESAIMTWIYRGSNAAVSDVIYSTSNTNSACTQTIHFTLGADRKLSGGHVISNNANDGCKQNCDGGACEISSGDALSTGSWHHVSMVSNDIYGLTLYANGASVANLAVGVWEKTLMDLPTGMTSTSKTLFKSAYASNSYVYDDARIYSGIVRDLHIASIYSCGRSELCANRAYASPQSRRTYCIVLNYVDDNSDGRVSTTLCYWFIL